MRNQLLMTSAVAAVMALTACSKKDDGDNRPTANIPSQLGEMEIVQARSLSRAEKDELTRIFKGIKVIPSAELLISDRDSKEQKQKKADKIRKLQGREKQLFQSMRDNCSLSITGDNGTDKEGRSGSVISSDTYTTLTGRYCPVVGTRSDRQQIEVLYNNVFDLQAEAKQNPNAYEKLYYVANFTSQTTVDRRLSASLQKELGVQGITGSLSMAGSQEMKGRSKRAYGAINGKMNYELTRGNVDAEINAEVLTNNSEDQRNIKMSLRAGNTHVIFQAKTDGRERKFYVNGQRMSEFEVREIFGNLANILD